VVLDSIESLFASLANEAILRSELRRLFRGSKVESSLPCYRRAWRSSLTRHGLEEYISDCVILLDHRVTETVFTRRLRVVKYRGSSTARTSTHSSSTRTASRFCGNLY